VTALTGLRRPGGAWRVVTKVWGVLWITLVARLAYLGELLIRSIFMLLILYIFTQLWRATGASVDLQATTGFSLAQLIWYLAFTEAIALSSSFRYDEVDREVRSGDIAYRLARPMPYPAFHLGAYLGDRLVRFVITLALGVVVARVVAGPVSLQPLSVLAALLAAVVGFCVDWVFTFTLALLAFWFEDTSGLQLLYRRAVMLLGGMLVPLEAYPDWLADVCRALPFRYIMYEPARLFVAPAPGALPHLLLAQVAFGAAGLLPLLLVYWRGLRRASAQGG
jgi:ABC-2 type transport system permease protein